MIPAGPDEFKAYVASEEPDARQLLEIAANGGILLYCWVACKYVQTLEICQ
jgi:hypothetical protein